MAKNYNKMAIDIVREIGGEENVKSLAHCMTRLRFIVKDEKKSISNIDNVNNNYIVV